MNETFTGDMLSQGVPLYLKILASIFYIISMVLGVGGNTLVLLIFIYYQRTKSVTQFFIINLAISDLIFAILCIPSTYITAYMIQYWPFSGFFCIFLNYMQNVSVTLTVYTLIWLTLDKFWALVKPLKVRMSIKVCKSLIGLSWLFSLFVSLPIALVTRLTYQTLNSSSSLGPNMTMDQFESTATLNDEVGLPQCGEHWPEKIEHLANAYNISLTFIQYFLPLVFVSFCYAKIGTVLRKQQAPGESIHNRDAKMSQSKRKVSK
jgi:neuropeptide Y receptor